MKCGVTVRRKDGWTDGWIAFWRRLNYNKARLRVGNDFKPRITRYS